MRYSFSCLIYRVGITGLLTLSLYISLVLVTPRTAFTQELNIDVTIDRSRVDNASLDFLDNLEQEIEAYLNDYDWVDENFSPQERINGQFQIILLSADNNFNFQANVIIQSQRPIYNSLRETTMLLFNDENWSFQYTPNRSLVHDELQFDGVATFLDFYAYLIIGLDFDSFSELGGSPYFSEAANLVSIAEASTSPGWSRTGSTRRNRTKLVSDLLDPNYEDFRRALYVYHRQGLDLFLTETTRARAQIVEALKLIQNSKRVATDNFLFDTFFNAKYREIATIFDEANSEIRLEVYNILSEIDQSHLNTYENLQ